MGNTQSELNTSSNITNEPSQNWSNVIEDDNQQVQKFGNIPLMPLRNYQCDLHIIPSSQTKGMRAIVITDTHLGKFFPGEPNIPILYNYLKDIVTENSANVIFWLGDMIDYRAQDRENLGQKFLDAFSEFAIPIQFISGNHDRGIYRRLRVHGSMHYIQTKLLKIESPSTSNRPIFFAHDFGNPFKLSYEEIQSFLVTNKIAQRSKISPQDWLITGHTHATYVDENLKVASLAPFSIDMKSFCYGLLVENGGGFDMSLHKLETKNSIESKVQMIEEKEEENDA